MSVPARIRLTIALLLTFVLFRCIAPLLDRLRSAVLALGQDA